MRRLSRWGLATGVLACGWLLTACHGGPHVQYTVTTTADGPDAVPGDGVCEMTPGGADCSVRAAIDEWSAAGPGVGGQVLVPSGSYALSVAGDDDDNTGGDLDAAASGGGSLVIVGEAPGVEIDAAGADHAIDAVSGTLRLRGVAVTGATGSGVRVQSGAELDLGHASAHGNGWAGVEVAAGGAADLWQSTVSTNTVGGVANAGSVTALYATVTANTGGGFTGSGSVSLTASVVADQSSGSDCGAAVSSSGGFNLDSDGSCGLGAASDLSGVSAALQPLTAELVPAHDPDGGSPVIDSVWEGDPFCPKDFSLDDQRADFRPAGRYCDRGAIEANLLENPDAETGVIDPWGEAPPEPAYTVVPAPPGHGAYVFRPSDGSGSSMAQGIDVSRWAALIDGGTNTVGIGVDGRSAGIGFNTLHLVALSASHTLIAEGDVGDLAVLPYGTRVVVVVISEDACCLGGEYWVDNISLTPPY